VFWAGLRRRRDDARAAPGQGGAGAGRRRGGPGAGLTANTRTCSTFGMAEHTPTIKELARASQAAAGRKDREAWLALFAPDAVIEDPIGPSPFDPEGKGHRGTEGINAFYDNVIE
jgi:hypothetical protein